MSEPIVEIKEISKMKISDETGHDVSNVVFSFDVPVQAYSVNIIGTSHSSGTVAAEGSKFVSDYQLRPISEVSLMSVREVRQLDSNSEINAEIDFTELYREGINRVNIYGKSLSGEWTRYIDE